MVGEVDKERLLFAYQISKQIVNGQFPINKELAFELSALMAQVRNFNMYLVSIRFFSLNVFSTLLQIFRDPLWV